MGNPKSTSTSTSAGEDQWKNVVIIGASFAGHSLANGLGKKLPANYRIVLIERTPFAIHLPALVRAVVVPGSHERDLTKPLTRDAVFPAPSRHVLLCPASVQELRAGSVVLDTEFEGSAELPFALSAALHSQLEARGAEIVLSDRLVLPTANTDLDNGQVSLQSGRKIAADCVVMSTGNRPASKLMYVLAADAVAGRTGHVVVDAELCVLSTSTAVHNYYALGDVCSSAGRKTASQANGEAMQLGGILLSHIADCESRKRVERKRPARPFPISVMLVPLGHVGGAGSIDLGVFGVWAAPQWLVRWFGRDYFVKPVFHARFHGKVDEVEVAGKQ